MKTLSIRLATENGKVVARELQDIGRTGEQALKRIEQASVPASNQLQALSSVVGGLKCVFVAGNDIKNFIMIYHQNLRKLLIQN